MHNIVASKLINDLILNTDTSSQLILAEVQKAKSLVGQNKLSIEIDTDDDFAVNGKSYFSKSFELGERDIIDVYKEAINSITFGSHPNKNYKQDNFLAYIMEDDFLAEVSTGHASTGGNQTIDVNVTQAPTTLYIGSLQVDLTK